MEDNFKAQFEIHSISIMPNIVVGNLECYFILIYLPPAAHCSAMQWTNFPDHFDQVLQGKYCKYCKYCKVCIYFYMDEVVKLRLHINQIIYNNVVQKTNIQQCIMCYIYMIKNSLTICASWKYKKGKLKLPYTLHILSDMHMIDLSAMYATNITIDCSNKTNEIFIRNNCCIVI